MPNTDDTLSSRGTAFTTGSIVGGPILPSSTGLLVQANPAHSDKQVVAQSPVKNKSDFWNAGQVLPVGQGGGSGLGFVPDAAGAGMFDPQRVNLVPGMAQSAIDYSGIPGSDSNNKKEVVYDQPVNRDTFYRRPFYMASGRLISLSHSKDSVRDYLLGENYISNMVVIYFPANPDSIDLIRTTDYKVSTNFFLPDGIHQYRATNPLEIPFSFSLTAFDKEYCSKGALTLLQIAARLHALTLPVGPSNSGLTATAVGPATTGSVQNSSKTEAAQIKDLEIQNLNNSNPPYFPVACILDLIYTGDESPGIRCTGYIKSVKVKLKQPFLQTQNPSHKNLPSAADYEFVFVHRPGYTNQFSTWKSGLPLDLNIGINAMADDVKSSLYNTVGILKQTNYVAQGFRT